MTTPSGAVLGWTYGSTGNNSDTDLITGMYHGSGGSAVIDSATWYPFGPLETYNQENSNGTYGKLMTSISRPRLPSVERSSGSPERKRRVLRRINH
jgi:hypothetical protein